LEKRNGSSFYSLDLSAATDRLPVHLQEDILEVLGLNGRVWKQILDRPYYYDGIPYKYAVGQPMGAYSSFAMLALTNHLLVHVAHLKAFNKSLTKGLGSYAVLGDDIVISDRELANSYNYFMNYVLGVTAVLADYFKKEYNSILKLELSVLTKILKSIFDKEDMQQ